jgi:hypothetical protein
MTAKIEKEFSFLAAVHFEGDFLINDYTLTLFMDVETENQREQVIAIERANYFLHNYVASSVFVQDTEKKAIDNYAKAGISTLVLPEEPYDQIIGIILLSKLNAIMEGKLIITDIVFMSTLAADIKFHTPAEEVVEFAGKNWWNDSSTRTKNINKKDKIVAFNENEWTEIGLTWKEPESD